MRFILLSALLFGLALTPLAAQSETAALKARPDAETEARLRKLEREWLDAYDNNDVAAMTRIVADDFQITYPDGRTLNKKQTLAMLKPDAAKDPDEAQYTEDSVVRVYGKTAVITGTYVHKRREGEQEIFSRSRYTDTYVKRKGRWQVVSSHLSAISNR
jgi:hypothetical protein